MATTMKRETLKSIGNVPDWVLKQRTTKDGKKGATTPSKVVRPNTTTKASTPKRPKVVAPVASAIITPVSVVKPTTVAAAPIPVSIPQIIKEEVKDPQDNAVQTSSVGSKVRRIYSRDFLIKFKYTAPSFPPGMPTPVDLIAQYNKEFELKERERLAHQDISSLTNIKAPTTPASTPAHATSTPKTTGEKKLKKKEGEKMEGTKKATTEKNAFKLRLGNNDDSILRSPLFRASAKTSTSTRHATPPPSTIKVEDKENPLASVTAKPARPSSISKTRSTSPQVQRETVQVSTFTPVPVATPVEVAVAPSQPASAPLVIPAVAAPVVDVPMQDAKQEELVDALTKKLKAALKETDPRRLAQRQKQIEYGKATPGYQDYMKLIAKSKRKREDPKTPNKYQVCSKRSWDGQVRKWRRMLHFYDPADLKDTQTNEEMDSKHFVITEADLLAEENALRE